MSKDWVERSVEIKKTPKNCAQAVALTLAEREGIDIPALDGMMLGFGKGIGYTMDNTCGALVGAITIEGIVSTGETTKENAKKISNRFKELCGAHLCKELKGVETKSPLCSCEDCVKNAVRCYLEVHPEAQTAG